jgi:hypothetical protein
LGAGPYIKTLAFLVARDPEPGPKTHVVPIGTPHEVIDGFGFSLAARIL